MTPQEFIEHWDEKFKDLVEDMSGDYEFNGEDEVFVSNLDAKALTSHRHSEAKALLQFVLERMSERKYVVEDFPYENGWNDALSACRSVVEEIIKEIK